MKLKPAMSSGKVQFRGEAAVEMQHIMDSYKGSKPLW